ncbi:MAG: calcium/sodium antiporter [Balneolia bacterium]|nr:calcium/sodium antiporter [Balneolia bacterium]
MLTALLWLFAGVGLLTYGADRLVAGSSAIALRTGIAPLLIGLTIVAFATSSPELLVSIVAAYQGKSGIAIGNVVGSNIANIGLVLGAAALIYPVKAEKKMLQREMPYMVGAVALLYVLMYNDMITRIEGIALIVMLFAFLVYQIRRAQAQMDRFNDQVQEVMVHKTVPVWLAVFRTVLGTACLYFGSEAFLAGAVDIGTLLGVSDAVIGLTVISIGTSLPELATTIMAALRKETGMALGNIIGSNIFNVFAVLGITAVIIPLDGGGINYIDLSVMMVLTLVIWGLFQYNRQLGRISGLLLLIAYAAYMVWLFQ